MRKKRIEYYFTLGVLIVFLIMLLGFMGTYLTGFAIFTQDDQTAFDEGTTLDTNFWSDDNCLRDGTVVQDGGEVTLETNTTANGLAVMESVRKARFVAGSAQLLAGSANFVTAATANNTRRIGAYTLDVSLDPEDGFYFQMAGETFSVGHCLGGSCTLVNSGSFNGIIGATWSQTENTY